MRIFFFFQFHLANTDPSITLQLVFSLLLPCLIFSQLGQAITLQKMLEWYVSVFFFLASLYHLNSMVYLNLLLYSIVLQVVHSCECCSKCYLWLTHRFCCCNLSETSIPVLQVLNHTNCNW